MTMQQTEISGYEENGQIGTMPTDDQEQKKAALRRATAVSVEELTMVLLLDGKYVASLSSLATLVVLLAFTNAGGQRVRHLDVKNAASEMSTMVPH